MRARIQWFMKNPGFFSLGDSQRSERRVFALRRMEDFKREAVEALCHEIIHSLVTAVFPKPHDLLGSWQRL